MTVSTSGAGVWMDSRVILLMCLCVFDFASFSVFINIALGFDVSFLLSSHFKIKVTADNYYFEGI